MKKIILTFALLLFVSSQAFAFNYTYHDFGQDNIFDHNNNYAPINYPHGVGNLPSGGEDYDLEALNVAADDDFLYISLTNSFGYERTGFRLGDMFIGVGDEKYSYAVDLQAGGANGGLYEVGSWNYIQQQRYSYYNYDSIRNAAGAHELNTGTRLGDVASMMTFESGLETNSLSSNRDTYVWEMRLDRSLINGGDLSNLSFHINIGCGNDLMETKYSSAPTPPSSVPEPATMVLFGLGLMGGAIRKKYKS